jgi:hypothetical protein
MVKLPFNAQAVYVFGTRGVMFGNYTGEVDAAVGIYRPGLRSRQSR